MEWNNLINFTISIIFFKSRVADLRPFLTGTIFVARIRSQIPEPDPTGGTVPFRIKSVPGTGTVQALLQLN